ncbi:hypothetical protein DVH24_014682 [Malus domestica]|uniref:Uncharacterized protein n=1 Tax=Malus domestica TaxID=3750 RepID=A0A498I9M6_MALDO|nr:hypothetical protein DVH24_014682 [Malus domestica]
MKCDYTLDKNNGGAINETIVDVVIGDVERDLENVPLNDGRAYSDGFHSVNDSGSEVVEKIIYLEFDEEADRDDPKFEKGLKSEMLHN